MPLVQSPAAGVTPAMTGWSVDSVAVQVYIVNAVYRVNMIHNVVSVATLSWMPRKSLPQSEKKAPIAARIDPKLLDRLVAAARDDDRTLSYMVEKIVREYFERLDRRPRR